MSKKVVYSSETGVGGRRVADGKRKKKSERSATPQQSQPGSGRVVVRLEKKGRKGHGATLIEGLAAGTDLKSLAKELKSKCGSGGKVASGAIEIQGDHRDRIVELLAAKGIEAKRGN